MRKLSIFGLASAGLGRCSPHRSRQPAQSWPERTVRLVVPYPPGGNVDGAARIVANKLQEKLGQPVVIENKAGAGGLIGGEMVAKSAPDGYTLFVGANGPILFAPEISGKRSYEWSKDFAPITTISLTPLVLQVHPSVPAKTLSEFFELAKREPGKLNDGLARRGHDQSSAERTAAADRRRRHGPPCTIAAMRRPPTT